MMKNRMMNQIMKKRILIVITIIICLALTSCVQPQTNVAISIYDENDTFMSELMSKMSELTNDDETVEIVYASNSQVIQNQQIASLIDANVKVMAINPVDRLACNAIAEKCVNSGVNMVFFNREPLEDVLRTSDSYYVGTDAGREGKKQAIMAAELFGSNFRESPYDKNNDGIVQIVIIKGEQGHQDAERRTDNCLEELREQGYSAEILGVEVADWSRSKGYEAMKRLYESYEEEIELVFSNNDDMAIGAIDYLLEVGAFSENLQEYDQPFVIVGVDGTAVGLSAIKKGLLYGTVKNDSENQANAVMTLVDYILDGKDMVDFPYVVTNDRYIYIEGDIITLKNLKDNIE